MDGVMAIGSFTFVADPNDPTRCSEECPQLQWIESPFSPEPTLYPVCGHFVSRVDRIDGGILRTWGCRESEKHEAERPAKWLNVFPSVNGSLCSACGALTTIEPKPKQCQHCGRKMVQDET